MSLMRLRCSKNLGHSQFSNSLKDFQSYRDSQYKLLIFFKAFYVADLLPRSFVPPVRDEESETQRKAHAKRVRETRRSTQGVTLEEIKSAEQIVKSKNQNSDQVSWLGVWIFFCLIITASCLIFFLCVGCLLSGILQHVFFS